MIKPLPERLKQRPDTRARLLTERAIVRTAGASLIAGNAVRLLKDARENYPAWLAAIRAAEHTIHFESYILHQDKQGYEFADALMARARLGVRVRLIYDWAGALNATSNSFWRELRAAGIEVRCFNTPRFDSPFGWISRDHRKMITVDKRIGFVAGLCVGQMWVGDETRGIDPWRDTGVEVCGPAVAEIENAFAQMWTLCGAPLPKDENTGAPELAPAGSVNLRVVAGMPNGAGLYRLDQMIAATARKTLWLTDAYFAATTPYVQSLRAAAMDGVDVRLLVPQATDIPVVRALSRTGYRSLLEGGVRVFEWNGAMLHAKTAVADGRWARVGSTNLNLASWLGNWELDVIVENQGFGHAMEQMYLDDLQNATEIVLTARNRIALIRERRRRKLREQFSVTGSSRAAAGAIRLGNAVSAALTNHRVLSPSEARITASAGLLLLCLSGLAVWWPHLLTVPLAFLGAWVAISLFLRAYDLHQEGRRETKLSLATKSAVAETPKEVEKV
ncbi:MAG: cardiolipin synthase B [Acidobacteria bacterium]|nr:cardiolipin synthase B [Acidobacteriota bacterium]MBI3424738.1 cardiolipin synthase B [Acidobacteriota bacterium]